MLGALRLLLILKPLAYGVALVCGLILTLSGFGPGLLGQRLQGFLLMAHMGSVPPFLLSVAFLSVTCAKQHDLRERMTLGSLCFWLLLGLTVPLTVTILLSMFPLTGTEGLNALLGLHESIALVFVVAAVLYVLLRVRSKATAQDGSQKG